MNTDSALLLAMLAFSVLVPGSTLARVLRSRSSVPRNIIALLLAFTLARGLTHMALYGGKLAGRTVIEALPDLPLPREARHAKTIFHR